MGELSLVFHLASLLVVCGLIYWVLREQKSLGVWRRWCSADAGTRIEVAEVLRALKSFSKAVGAEFNSECALNQLPPARIQLIGLFKLHQQSSILAISIENQSPPCVRFDLKREPSTMIEVKDQIVNELGNSIGIEFQVR